MNTELTRHDLFHSSISIISIKPKHVQNYQRDFFKQQNYLDDRNFSQQIQNTEFVKVSNENQSPLYGSLLDKILFTTCNQADCLQPQLSYWIGSNHQMGCSESQESASEEIQNRQAQKDEKSTKIKSKAFQRQQFYLQNQYDDFRYQNSLISRKFQNQTKNIPKNYGKAIIAFSLKNFKKYEHLPDFCSINFQDFKKQLVLKRKTINSIAGLKSLWMDFKYARCMRLLSNQFLRRHSLSYIFNSRISNVSPHVKYRYKLCEAIRQPLTFNYIKDY